VASICEQCGKTAGYTREEIRDSFLELHLYVSRLMTISNFKISIPEFVLQPFFATGYFLFYFCNILCKIPLPFFD
jgi:hypothetical protein